MHDRSRTIRLELDVPGDPLRAFESFVDALDERWAGATPGGGPPTPGDIDIEAHAGGTIEAGTASKPLELGRITVWQPGRRLEADWREPDWLGDISTSITVSFEAADGATHVRVEHRGFDLFGEMADSMAERYETRWREVLAAVEGSAHPPAAVDRR